MKEFLHFLVPGLVSLLFLALFGSYFFAQHMFSKKMLLPLADWLDQDLRKEIEKNVLHEHNEKAGVLHILVITIGFIIAIDSLNGWAKQEMLPYVISLTILFAGSWYAFQLHVLLRAYTAGLDQAKDWQRLVKTSGKVKTLCQHDTHLVVMLATENGELSFYLSEAASKEAERDLTVGAEVSIYASDKQAHHLVVTAIADKEMRRRLVEEAASD